LAESVAAQEEAQAVVVVAEELEEALEPEVVSQALELVRVSVWERGLELVRALA
jgi:hypothetical protein